MQSPAPYTHKELLEAGVHLGHQKRKWNPKMSRYIYTESEGIHLIDLNKTLECLNQASHYIRGVAKSGKKILFVATKRQAKNSVKNLAEELGVFHVTERWLGGMLTNFITVRKSVRKMQQIEKVLADNEVNTLTKKEKLTMNRDKSKIGKVLGGVSNLNNLPGCVVIADILDEHIALAEARKLKIPVIAIVDTNTNPELVDYPIPANDDSSRSIELIFKRLGLAIQEGLEERKQLNLEATERAAEQALEAENAAAQAKLDEENAAKDKGGRRPFNKRGNTGYGGGGSNTSYRRNDRKQG